MVEEEEEDDNDDDREDEDEGRISNRVEIVRVGLEVMEAVDRRGGIVPQAGTNAITPPTIAPPQRSRFMGISNVVTQMP